MAKTLGLSMIKTNPLNHNWLDFAIQLGLALHQFQKKLLLRQFFLGPKNRPIRGVPVHDKQNWFSKEITQPLGQKNSHIQPNCIFSALIQYRDVHLPLRHRNVILELSYIYLQYPSRRKNERPIFSQRHTRGHNNMYGNAHFQPKNIHAVIK